MPKNHSILHKQPIYYSTSFTNLSNGFNVLKYGNNSNFYSFKNTMYKGCKEICQGLRLDSIQKERDICNTIYIERCPAPTPRPILFPFST